MRMILFSIMQLYNSNQMDNKISFFQSDSVYNFTFAILLSLLLNICATSNFISQNVVWNGNFQLPTLPGPQSCFSNIVNNWTGDNFELQNYKYNHSNNMLFNQYIDLQSIPYHNGYIQQTLQVKNKGICNLSYYYTCLTNAFNSYIMEVYWNGNMVWTQQPNSLAIMMNQLTLQANEGINVLKFVEVGDDSDWSGLFIDQVALICGLSNNNESVSEQNQLQFNSLIEIVLLGLFVPVPQCTPLRPLYLFTNDIWIYNYDIIDYQNKTCLENILNTLTLLNSLSTKFLNRFTKLQKIKNNMRIGNKYINFTNEKFRKVEQTSSILIDSCFFYFLQTCPSVIFTNLLLYFIYCCIKKFRISRFFQKFNFVKTIIVLSVFQCNITYFVYVCLNHINNCFTFALLDKLYLIFTVFFLFLMTIFAISFYFLMDAYLKKSSGHFLHSLKRSHQSLNFLTIKNLIRGYILGCIHFFLFGKYQTMLTLLCCVQCTIIMIMLFYEKKKKIFLVKIKFLIQILYHFSFVLLNLILYAIFTIREENKQGQAPFQALNTIKQLMQQFEQIILHLQIFLLLTHTLIDCFPKRLFKASKQFKLNEKEIMQLKLNKRKNKKKQSQKQEQKKNKNKLNINLQKVNKSNNHKDTQKKNARLEIDKKQRQQVSRLQKIMQIKVKRVKKQKKQKLQLKLINYVSNIKYDEKKIIQKQYNRTKKQNIEIKIKARKNKKR